MWTQAFGLGAMCAMGVCDFTEAEISRRLGIVFISLATVGYIDLVHILHQVQRLLFPDMLVKGAAKIIGNIVLSVGESPGAAEAAHDGAALAPHTGGDPLAVDGAVPLFQRVTRFKHSNFQIRTLFGQFIGGKNASRSGAHNNHIIIHTRSSR